MRLQSRFQSIRSIVTSIIVVLGLLSMAATLITGQVYHSLTLNSQLENIERHLHLETLQSMQRVKQFSLQLSTLIINSDEFKNSLNQPGKAAAQKYLQSLPMLPFMQSGVLSVRYVNLFDENHRLVTGYELLNRSSKESEKPICGHSMSLSKPTSYAIATDVVYGMCVYEDTPYMSISMPFSSGKRNGFIELVSNIKRNISHIDQIMNFPIRLKLKNNKVIYVSDSWPYKYQKSSVATYPIKDDLGHTVLYIDALHLDSSLEKALSFAQMLVISGAVISILAAVLLALYILKQTVISPVNEVVVSLRKVKESRDNLGSQVRSRGAEEIIELMDDFNAMSSALYQLYDTLEKMTYTDSLTRLGNRKLFHEKLEQVYKRSKSSSISFALLLIDLNKFKQVNDTYGHMVGDQLLIETSNRFSDVIRRSQFAKEYPECILASPVQDVLIRLGGDEFAVILPEVNGEEDAVALAKSLNKILQEPVVLDGHTIDYGMSIGIALCPDHAGSIEELIHRSDEAMYESKKNQLDYVVYKMKN